jgi:hypothetical protein
MMEAKKRLDERCGTSVILQNIMTSVLDSPDVMTRLSNVARFMTQHGITNKHVTTWTTRHRSAIWRKLEGHRPWAEADITAFLKGASVLLNRPVTYEEVFLGRPQHRCRSGRPTFE